MAVDGRLVTATPRLRFPEFRETEWIKRKLGTVLRFQPGYPFPSAGFNDDGRGLRLIRNRDLRSEERMVFFDGPFDESFVVNDGDILVGMDGDFTPSVWTKGPALLNQRVGRIQPRDENNQRFLLYFLVAHLKAIEESTARTTVKHLSHTDVEKIEEPIPIRPEQQKIADCLTSLDEWIAAERRKMDALQAYKKGLMQQLFPREGESSPRVRFPQFRNAPTWNLVPLGTIAEIKLGKMLDGKRHTTGRLLPYLNNLSVRWNKVDTSNLPQMYFDDNELEGFGLKAGDVVVCEGGEPGRAAVWDGRLPELKFQKAIHRVRFNVAFEPHLLVLHLQAIAGTPAFEGLFTGGGIKHLTRETFARLLVPMMTELEQQRIAACFSALNALIDAQLQKLDSLRVHKEGLMQQLFPSPDGV